MRHNGIQLPSQPVVQPVMNVAAPLNDTQLVSLMAVHCPGVSPADKVDYAVQIVLEAMRRLNAPEFAQKCQALVKDLQKEE